MVTLKLIDTKAAPQNVCLQLPQLKKMILRKWEQLVSMLASYPHCKFRVLHCTNQYTVSLKMCAQGGIVTLNSINYLSPLLINANCEKE